LASWKWEKGAAARDALQVAEKDRMWWDWMSLRMKKRGSLREKVRGECIGFEGRMKEVVA
jgi:hypothetical protein